MNMFKSTEAKNPRDYIASLDEPRRSQINQLHRFIRKTVPELKPYIQNGMLGYGSYHYKYASGREGDWCLIGLASQKNYISIYACATVDGGYLAEKYRARFPKASIGKSCIRFKRIEDIDFDAIKELLLETAAASICHRRRDR
jgi:hypothetical protein